MCLWESLSFMQQKKNSLVAFFVILFDDEVDCVRESRSSSVPSSRSLLSSTCSLPSSVHLLCSHTRSLGAASGDSTTPSIDWLSYPNSSLFTTKVAFLLSPKKTYSVLVLLHRTRDRKSKRLNKKTVLTFSSYFGVNLGFSNSCCLQDILFSYSSALFFDSNTTFTLSIFNSTQFICSLSFFHIWVNLESSLNDWRRRRISFTCDTLTPNSSDSSRTSNFSCSLFLRSESCTSDCKRSPLKRTELQSEK